MGEFELGDMEDRVHRLHRVGESECEGNQAVLRL